MPPVPPVGPGSMNMHNHQRRESAQSAHTESGHLHGQRGGMQNSGRRGGGGHAYGHNNSHHYQQGQYSNGYPRGGYTNTNQNRGPPPNMNPQAYGVPGPAQGYNTNSPRNMHRSPAMSHASPSLPAVLPMVTSQLYPPPPPPQYMPLQVSSPFLSFFSLS